jgi:peptidoglycan/xylan/chitin deacetylase (PgdA/CDA1 family)
MTRAAGWACVYSGLARRCLRLRHSGAHPALTILAYHRVGDPHAGTEAGDPALMSASAAGFEWQMSYLSRHFDVLPLTDVVDRLRGGRTLPPSAAAITFDDGYRDNYDVAFPVLCRLDLPATVFLVTGFVGDRRPLWWDEMAMAIATAGAHEVEIEGVGSLPLTTRRARRRATAAVRRHMKALPEEERRPLIDALLRQLDPGPGPETAVPALTWWQARAMSREGFTFGAHTHTHPILTQLPPEQAEWEVVESKRIVECELGTPVTLFAYPNGRRGDLNGQTRHLVAGAGFDAAVSLIHGSNVPGAADLDLYALRRVYVGSDDRAVFVAKVSGAFDALAARLPWRPVQ